MKKIITFIAIVLILFGGVLFYQFKTGSDFLWGNYGQLFGSKSPKKEPCNLTPRPREFNHEPYYTGPLIDAHLHLPTSSKIVSVVSTKIGKSTPAWDKDLSLHYLNCLFGTEGTIKAFGFHLITKYSASVEVKTAKEMEKKYPGKIAHFLMPTMVSPWINPDIKTLKNILEKNPGLFVGLGELKMFDGKNPDDPYLLDLYELAKKYNLIVMMHPFDHHKKIVEKVVGKYPEVKFLFHGIHGEGGYNNNMEWVTSLIKNNPNVYYSVDHSLPIYGFKKEHIGKVVSEEELLPHIKTSFNSQFDEEIARWKTRIETYPDRFIGGGTDRWHLPQFDPEMSALINEFQRSVIGQLAPKVQEKFAYKNAQKLLQR
ncbi:MAG: amidohydrolase family protein [bacterium]|nr:amidohydrolase family protein [bacterium]